jgi:hypothetical protein
LGGNIGIQGIYPGIKSLFLGMGLEQMKDHFDDWRNNGGSWWPEGTPEMFTGRAGLQRAPQQDLVINEPARTRATPLHRDTIVQETIDTDEDLDEGDLSRHFNGAESSGNRDDVMSDNYGEGQGGWDLTIAPTGLMPPHEPMTSDNPENPLGSDPDEPSMDIY